MKKQDKKTAGKKAKINSALTGPGLLMTSELDEATGGAAKGDETALTTALCSTVTVISFRAR
jgi:hypothetical protein